MTSYSKPQSTGQTGPGPARIVLGWFASLKLAVILIVVLALILSWATFVEADRGREYAQWRVYKANWFISLLGLLTVNVLAATLVRFPWKLRQIGFLVTHTGILILLAGSAATYWKGMEGQVSLVEPPAGGTPESAVPAEMILMTSQSLISAGWPEEKTQVNLDFAFQPGADDWREGETLDLGEADGVAIRVLKFYRHARSREDWVEDPSGQGSPAMQFVLSGPDGETIHKQWLTLDRFGSDFAMGPLRVAISRAPVATMLQDFTDPPIEGAGQSGILSVHYDGRVQRLDVDQNKGHKVPLGESGISVEIVDYYPDAMPTSGGRFSTRSESPNNPLLELRIYLPDREEPVREIAFAGSPLLNLDGVRGFSLPVKFYYHHPALGVPTGAEFLQIPGGKLYGRVGIGGHYQSRGEVALGQPLETAAGFAVTAQQSIPHAIRKVSFRPIRLASGEPTGPEAAALVEVSAWGTTEEIWLQRFHPKYGHRSIQTDRRPLEITFGYVERPMGFALKLVDFKRGLNPGGMGNASFSSDVTLTDKARQIYDEEHLISMNEPLTHGKITFYQSSYQELPDGRQMSILSAAYDPGRFLKYFGSVMICAGTLLMMCRRAKFFGKRDGPEWKNQGVAAGSRSKKRSS